MRTRTEEQADFPPAVDAESALYDGFLDNADRRSCEAVRNAQPRELATFSPIFHDERLPELFLHYKARNFADTLSEAEQKTWEKYRQKRLQSQQNNFIKAMQELAQQGADHFLLEELQLWYQSLQSY